MAGSLSGYWRRFQHSSDAYLAVTAMLAVLIVAPIAVSGYPEIERPLTAVLAGSTVALSMAASNARGSLTFLALLASAVVLVVGLLPGEDRVALAAGVLVLGILMVVTPAVILNRVARHSRITATTLWGTIAAYLSAGLAFSLFYAAANGFDTNAFPGVEGVSLGEFNYFSFVTMTTLGYGDVIPGAQLAKALAVLQTILGQIFLVVVVARVVSLLGSERVAPHVTSVEGTANDDRRENRDGD